MQLKDELNDLRDWRENYLKQQKLAQISNENHRRDNGSRESSQENKVNEDISDNASTTSSASNQTASSKTSKSSRNHITVKQKVNIMKIKSMRAINNARSNMSVPSLSNLLSTEFGTDDEKTAPLPYNYTEHRSPSSGPLHSRSSSLHDITKEHNEVIQALSDRLAIVKENYMNLKLVVSGKDEKIEKLNFELSKKMEMIADLIEKLNDKPLPPTPTQLAKLEQAENEYKQKEEEQQTDEDKVLINLEEQGLSGSMGRKSYVRHNGNSKPPPLPSGAPPPLNGSRSLDILRIQRSPPSGPPPKVVVSPSYNKGIGQNSHFALQQTATNNHNGNNGNNGNEQIIQNQLRKAKEQNYISNSKELNKDRMNKMQPLIVNNNNNDDDDDYRNEGMINRDAI